MATRLLLLAIALGVSLGLILPESQPASPSAATPAVSVAEAAPTAPGLAVVGTMISRDPDGHFYVDARVDGQPVRFLVDTGASLVALTVDDARRIGLNFSPAEFAVVGRGASGAVRGKPVVLDRIAVAGGEARQVRAAIIGEGLDVSLLGQSFLSRVGSVAIDGDRMTLR
ncbi:retropepsin-like aspartic protease family protein [Sphingomonas flavalba]|uniref:retropepsin-like aspartic protease family protein n=1 Tax=Sphingomonas flavalba TaxID=2559804 RepID=UPI00109E25A3|nr:TIGR02281 family clan AA aspartic protease [Sphingomonas flavalba]